MSVKPLEFFREPEVVRLLDRASRCGAAPIALHFYKGGREGVRIWSRGQCVACSYVAQLPGGKVACRKAREAAVDMALNLGAITPFFCHLGFAYLVAPALPESGKGFAMTFGPYCPAEEARALETDALDGLERLVSSRVDRFPVSLADIHVVPASAMPAVVEWTLEAIAARWHVAASDAGADHALRDNEEDGERAPRVSRRKRKLREPLTDPYQTADLAAAFDNGDFDGIRALLRGILAEAEPGRKRGRIAVRRARTVTAFAALLEAAERTNTSVDALWNRFPDLLAELRRATTDLQLAETTVEMLRAATRRMARSEHETKSEPEIDPEPAQDLLAAVRQEILEHIDEEIMLNSIAEKLGVGPTVITHRLQRKFGLSFTEYLGRLRVDKAKELLRRTKQSVTDIARRVGIDDVSNFGKLFRKFEGVSPNEYRRRFGR